MNTDTKFEISQMQGVLVRSDRVPSIQDIQGVINRYKYPCTLDRYGLDDTRGLFSGQIFGDSNAYVRFRIDHIADWSLNFLECDNKEIYDYNIVFDTTLSYPDQVLCHCCQLGIAEMSGGVIWNEDFNLTMNRLSHERIQRPLARLKLLKAIWNKGDGGVVSPQSPDLASWETPLLRSQSINELWNLGLIESVPEEADLPEPWCYRATKLGLDICRMTT